MTTSTRAPRLLIVDDLFGRTVANRRNEERANLCAHFLLEDVTRDESPKYSKQRIKEPVAQAFFFRGQQPACSDCGDTVENDLEATLEMIRQGWECATPDMPRWSLILLDLCFYTGTVTAASDENCAGMPVGRPEDDDPNSYFGLRLLQAIRDEFPDIPVIILSSKDQDEVSRQYAERGGLAFLPRERADSPAKLREYIWWHGLIPDVSGKVVGNSIPLLKALRAARRAASSRRNILIRGARGSGKELFAQYVHSESRNPGSPFVQINSAVLTPELYASELFGIRGRIATDVAQRTGLLTQADGGDVFLDEIKDMHPVVQAGVLRVLEYREVSPVGAPSPEPVDVRFVSATNVDIEGLSATGAFRADLLDRLREGGTIVLPPLKDRSDDIPVLVEYFVHEVEKQHPSAVARLIDPEALAKLCSYAWPGNVRELRSCVFDAINNHPHVEHLLASHITLPVAAPAIAEEAAAVAREQQYCDTRDADSITLDEVIAILSRLPLNDVQLTDIAARYPKLEAAYAELMSRYLRCALSFTARYTPDNLDGAVQIHPAVKLMTGDSSVTASKAADLVKRLRNISDAAEALWRSDPLLSAAHEIALRLRPSRQKQKSDTV